MADAMSDEEWANHLLAQIDGDTFGPCHPRTRAVMDVVAAMRREERELHAQRMENEERVRQFLSWMAQPGSVELIGDAMRKLAAEFAAVRRKERERCALECEALARRHGAEHEIEELMIAAAAIREQRE